MLILVTSSFFPYYQSKVNIVKTYSMLSGNLSLPLLKNADEYVKLILTCIRKEIYLRKMYTQECHKYYHMHI